MKLRKQIKNRVVAVAMLAVVLFGGLSFAKPETAYAASFSFTAHNWDYSKKSLVPYTRSINPISAKNSRFYVATRTDSDAVYFFVVAEDNPFDISYTDIDDGANLGTKQSSCDGSASVDGKNYYYHYFGYSGFHTSNQNNTYSWAGASKVYSYDSSTKLSAGDWVYYFVSGKFPEGVTDVTSTCNSSTDKSTWQGSQDNPQNDEDIGYLVLKTTNTNTQTDIDALKNGIQSVHYNLDWKNKTSTGFSLSKNKYARTFIQFEVESQYVVYSDAKHTKVKHKFDNYGERGWIAKNWDATSKPFSLTTDQVNAALPKSTNEILTQFDQNKIYQTGFTNGNIAINPLAFNFKIRYRVVCTNDITVIPDSSGGWHAGPWASTVIAGDEINDTSSHKSNHEGFGDDKNDNGESDDINHTKTDYDDNQDAKDHINDDPSDNDSNLTIDKAISFVKQVTKVPKLIGLALSWLPDWVTAPFFLAFALIPILIIYKFLRG